MNDENVDGSRTKEGTRPSYRKTREVKTNKSDRRFTQTPTSVLLLNPLKTTLNAANILVDKTWLETHIWHAKRMKMENMWGYRLVRNDSQSSKTSLGSSACYS